MTKRQNFRWFFVLAGVWGITLFLRCIPLAVWVRSLSFLEQLSFVVGGKKYLRDALKNLDHCYAELSQQEKLQLAKKSFAYVLLHMVLLLRGYPKGVPVRFVKTQGLDRVMQAKKTQKKIIFMHPHLGFWETLNLPQCVFGKTTDIPVISKTQGSFIATQLLQKQRKARGYKEMYGSKNGVLQFIRHYKNCGIGIISPDQTPPDEAGIFAKFFGQEVRNIGLLSKLVQEPSCEAFLLTLTLQQKTFVLQFTPLDCPKSSLPVITQRINDLVEDAVRLFPEQYYWGYRRFRHLSNGSDIYG